MFTLKSLLFIVAVAGVGAAGLINRTQFWASGLVGLTIIILLLAGLRAWFAPKSRAFWGPFTATGVLYLTIVSLQSLRELHYNLPTTQLVIFGLDKLQSATSVQMAVKQPATSGLTFTYAAPAMSGGTVTTSTIDSTLPISAPTFDSGGVDTSGALTLDDASGVNTATLTPGLTAAPPSGTLVVKSLALNRPALFQTATTLSATDGFPVQARSFLWVAQCLWSLLFALTAGITCAWATRTLIRA